MPLRFDDNWLRPSDLTGAANLRIVAWEGHRPMTFTVRRVLLVRFLPAIERAELSPALERWAQVI